MFYQDQHFGVSEYFCRETGENFSFPAHIHRSFECITVLEGEMTVTVGDARYVLTRGEGIVVFPEQIHALASTRSRHLLVIFSPDLIRAYHTRHLSDLPRSGKIEIPAYLLAQMECLESDSSAVKIKAVLYSLLSILDDTTDYVKRTAVEKGLLRSVFDFVENNFEKSCTLEDLSRTTGYNASYLSRYIHDSTDMPFLALVNRRRISHACELLRNSDKSVIDCAYESGYTSLRSFNRNFKLCLGVTPSEYRKTV